MLTSISFSASFLAWGVRTDKEMALMTAMVPARGPFTTSTRMARPKAPLPICRTSR